MTEPSRLLALLRRFDPLLAQAVADGERSHGAPGADPFRGLYIDRNAARRLANGEPTVTPGLHRSPIVVLDEPSRLSTLAARFGLAEFDAQVLLLAAAVDLDTRYERLFAYLQDDVTRRRASVELLLALLCANDAERAVRRSAFGADAPLFRQGLVEILPEAPQGSGFLSRGLRVDDGVVAYLLGDGAMDRRLTAASVVQLGTVPANTEMFETVGTLESLLAAGPDGARRAIQLCGGCAPTQVEAVRQAAARAGRTVLHADLGVLLGRVDLGLVAAVLVREARLKDAILLLSDVDGSRRPDADAARQLLGAAFRTAAIPLVVSGTTRLAPWNDTGPQAGPSLTLVSFADADCAQRRACWQLATAGTVAVTAEEIDELASRFTLSPSRIRHTAAIAAQAARARSEEATLSDVLAALRGQTTTELQQLARRIEPRARWADLVLPPDPSAQLREVCAHARRRHQVFDEWGFGRLATPGRGLAVLFSGGSGTGKTLAAEVLAHALGVDLYRIDLSRIVSKYIGETERNLDRVFTAALSVHGVLFFDEADALFGRRSEVKDSHDRYANIEVGYLLQKMEEFDGIAILATNLHSNIDNAFTRRMQFSVDFPFPDEEQRRLIWERHLPAEAPLAADVDFAFLARQFRLSGGNIRNITFAAAVMAADEETAIGMRHLTRAVRRELQKAGRSCHEAEFGPYYAEAISS